MKSDEIQSLFATTLETYVPVEGQPSDPDLSALRETPTALLLPTSYDGEKGIHNLVGLIMYEDDKVLLLPYWVTRVTNRGDKVTRLPMRLRAGESCNTKK